MSRIALIRAPDDWRSSSPALSESIAPQPGGAQPSQRAMIFILRSSSSRGKRSSTLQQLRVRCWQLREEYAAQFGLLRRRSLRLVMIQSARGKLNRNTSRQIQLFAIKNGPCDIVISGFNGFLTHVSELKDVFQVDERGLIVYQSNTNRFSRVDIQRVIQVESGIGQLSLDDFSQEFLTHIRDAHSIRTSLSLVHQQRAARFPDRNRIAGSRVSDMNRVTDTDHPESTTQPARPLIRYEYPTCHEQFIT